MKKDKNIVLIGFMGTGKTSVGIRLAEMLRMSFVDTDDIIEKNSEMSISDIFLKHGENYFRDLESEVAEKVSKLENQVIATGGGIVKIEKNIENLKKTGILFCLDASPEIILQRTSGYDHRPLLQVEDPISRIRDILKERDPLYAKADYRIDTSELTINEVINKIGGIFNLKHSEIAKIEMRKDGVNPANKEDFKKATHFNGVEFDWDGLAIDPSDNALIVYEVEALLPTSTPPRKHIQAEIEHLSIMIAKEVNIKKAVYITCSSRKEEIKSVIERWICLKKTVCSSFKVPCIEYRVLYDLT